MELLEQSGNAYNIVATANATEMVRSLVAVGAGVSLLNMRPGSVPTYASGVTVCVPLAGTAHGVTISLGFAPGPKRRLLQAFITAVSAYFDGPASADLIVDNEG